jgi:hypothetical protein
MFGKDRASLTSTTSACVRSARCVCNSDASCSHGQQARLSCAGECDTRSMRGGVNRIVVSGTAATDGLLVCRLSWQRRMPPAPPPVAHNQRRRRPLPRRHRPQDHRRPPTCRPASPFSAPRRRQDHGHDRPHLSRQCHTHRPGRRHQRRQLRLVRPDRRRRHQLRRARLCRRAGYGSEGPVCTSGWPLHGTVQFPTSLLETVSSATYRPARPCPTARIAR